MYLCYIDESGTPEISGNTSHFILAGIAIPIWKWKIAEKDISNIKSKYLLSDAEIHTGWILRPYLEQKKIANFAKLSYSQRRSEIEKIRKSELLRLQKSHKTNKLYHQTKKNYKQTSSYIHLTFEDRKKFIEDLSKVVSGWGFARIFAECIDKIFFDPSKSSQSISEQAFEQVISRFEQFLININKTENAVKKCYGLLIHDNNDTIAKKHTELMKAFHKKGTLWTNLNNIIETPLFVNSELTGLVQIADLIAYSLRRFLENNEDTLFNNIYTRADRRKEVVVGIRHFSNHKCKCIICQSHKSTPATSSNITTLLNESSTGAYKIENDDNK
jgi:hypothetical protein